VAFREIVVLEDEAAAAAEAAVRIAARLREAAAGPTRRGTLGLSGGSRASVLLDRLAAAEVPWSDVDVFQVDERVAPDGHEERNLTRIAGHLPVPEGRLHPMPVTDDDLDAAAAWYAASLPERFDVVHLGIGVDGHTASLVPGDPVLEVLDRDVAVSGPYEGRRRMTLTYPALARAGLAVWLVTGAAKAPAVRRLLADDERIPASGVAAPRQVVVADREAAAER
jgi:6-phosphogluconolactonase